MNYYNVGKIVNTQGLKGEVRVISITDFPDKRFKIGHTVLPSCQIKRFGQFDN